MKWESTTLKDVILENRATVNPQDTPSEIFDYYSIPAYQAKNEPIHANGASIHSQKLLVDEDTVLFGKLNPRVMKVWKVGKTDGHRMIASTEFVPLKPDDQKIDSSFLYFLCWSNSLQKVAKELVSGSTPSRQRIDVSAFLNTRIDLPQLPEQEIIAKYLTALDERRKVAEKVIATTRQLKQSLIHHLFTYGPVPVDEADHVELQDTEIGTTPKHWQIKRLGEVIEKPQYGLTASAVQKPVGPQFLRITDIQGSTVAWSDVPYADDVVYEKEKYALQRDDILVARIGATTGKSYLVREEVNSVFASYLMRLRAKEGLSPEYLYQFMQSPIYWQQINASKGGRLKQGINIPVLQNMLIPCPSQREQEVISNALTACDKKIATEKNKKEALDEVFDSLLDHLMTGKVRVNPDKIKV